MHLCRLRVFFESELCGFPKAAELYIRLAEKSCFNAVGAR